MTDKHPEFGELLCFDLYAASRALTAAYRPVLDRLGLTYPQYLVLVVLWEDGTALVGELAERLRLDYGTLTPLLRRMEKSGLVTRTRRLDDARAVEVGLTAAGQRLEQRAVPVQSIIHAATGLSGDEAIALQAVLRRITDSASATIAVAS